MLESNYNKSTGDVSAANKSNEKCCTFLTLIEINKDFGTNAFY